MAIKGEVHVKSMIWAPKISLNDGRYVIRPFECKIIGQAEGLARVKASIHTLFTTFDDEEWCLSTTSTASLNTLTFLLQVVGRLVNLLTSSRAKKAMLWLGKWNISIFLYAILMVPSMHKCIHSTHPSLLSRCTQVGSSFSHPTTRNSPCCNISLFKLHFWRRQTVPWWHSKVLAGRWWNNVSSSISPMEIWRYNCLAAWTRALFSTQLHQSGNWRPCLQWTQTEEWWFYCFYPAPWAVCIFHWQPGIQWSTTWTVNLMPMPVGQIGTSVPMSRRPNRE